MVRGGELALSHLGATGGDDLFGALPCADPERCGTFTAAATTWLPDVVAHAGVALCAVGAGAQRWCGAAATNEAPAEPSVDIAGWLARRGGEPLLVGLQPLASASADDPIARAVDLELAALLHDPALVRVMRVERGADAVAEGRRLGVVHVVGGRVGVLGDLISVELSRVDIDRGGEAVAITRQAPDAIGLATQLDGALLELLSTVVRTPDKDTIHAKVRAMHDQLEQCHERALATEPSLEGTIRVAWAILPSGRSTRATVKTNDTGSEALAACLISRVSGWVFEPGTIGEVTYPFVFEPR